MYQILSTYEEAVEPANGSLRSRQGGTEEDHEMNNNTMYQDPKVFSEINRDGSAKMELDDLKIH